MDVDSYVMLSCPPDVSLRPSPPGSSNQTPAAAPLDPTSIEWSNLLEDQDLTARRLVRAFHIALVTSGSVDVRVNYPEAPVTSTLPATPFFTPTRTSPRKRGGRVASAFSPGDLLRSPGGPLEGIDEDIEDDEDKEVLRSNVIQYLRTVAGLSTEAAAIGTLRCNCGTTERDVYDALAATLMQVQELPTVSLALSPVQEMSGLNRSMVDSSAGGSPPETPSAAKSDADATGSAQVAPLKKQSSLPTLKFPDLPRIADSLARSVASVAKFAGGYLGTRESEATAAPLKEQPLPTPEAQEGPDTAASTYQSAPESSARIRILIIDQAQQANNSVQELLSQLVQHRSFPTAALLQYFVTQRRAKSPAGGSKAGPVGLDMYAKLPWWHISSTAERPETLRAVTPADQFTITSSYDLREPEGESLPWDLQHPSILQAYLQGENPFGPQWAPSSITRLTSPSAGQYRGRGPSTAIARRPPTLDVGAPPSAAARARVGSAQSYFDFPDDTNSPTILAAKRFTPVPGLDTKYLLATGLIPPVAVGLSDLIPYGAAIESEESSFIIPSQKGPILLREARRSQSWTKLPDGFLIIVVSDNPPSRSHSIQEEWNALLNKYTREMAEAFGASQTLLNRIVPNAPAAKAPSQLLPCLAKSLMLHLQLSASVALSTVEAASAFADPGSAPTTRAAERHSRQASAGQQSQSSHISDLFSPRRGQEIAMAFAASEKRRWMRAMKSSEVARYLDLDCGINSVVVSDPLKDFINDCIRAARETTISYPEELSIERDSGVDIDASVFPLLEQLSKETEDPPPDAATAIAEYRVMLGKLFPPPSSFRETDEVFFQSSSFADNVFLASKAQAALEGRPYVTPDDVHAVFWSCICPPQRQETNEF